MDIRESLALKSTHLNSFHSAKKRCKSINLIIINSWVCECGTNDSKRSVIGIVITAWKYDALQLVEQLWCVSISLH